MHNLNIQTTDLMDPSIKLIHYKPIKSKSPAVLLVPPLGVHWYIFDFNKNHSFVNTLIKNGFEVFIIDFGIPDKTGRWMKIDDYSEDFIHAAVKEIVKTTKNKKITLIGYCMGGILSVIYATGNGKKYVKNIITIGTPYDFSKLQPFAFIAKKLKREILLLTNIIGNIPPKILELTFSSVSVHSLFKLGFKKSITKKEDAAFFVKNMESSNKIREFIPYPGGVVKQLIDLLLCKNLFFKEELKISGRTVKLSEINVPMLLLSGKDDNLAPPESIIPAISLLKNADCRISINPGGHISVMTGRLAADSTWKSIVQWLKRHN